MNFICSVHLFPYFLLEEDWIITIFSWDLLSKSHLQVIYFTSHGNTKKHFEMQWFIKLNVMKITGHKQSHMVIKLLMVTTGPCFLCLPQRENYKATECHSRVSLAYISIKSQPLPFSHLSKQHDWFYSCIVIKEIFFALSFLYILVSGFKCLVLL